MNAATAPNFSDLLNTSADEVERPKPLPTGSYLCVVKGLPEHGQSSQKKTPFLKFLLQPMQALEDVDTEALEEMGGLENKTIPATYYITEDAMWRLKKFYEDCGIEISGKTMGAIAEETVNKSVIGVIRHEASQDGTAVFARLADTALAE